jgi:MFS family permease
MGRVGDILGRKYLYIGGLAIFVGASAMAGFTPNLQSLIATKVLQGVESEIIHGNGMAAIISTFPGS